MNQTVRGAIRIGHVHSAMASVIQQIIVTRLKDILRHLFDLAGEDVLQAFFKFAGFVSLAAEFEVGHQASLRSASPGAAATSVIIVFLNRIVTT